MAVINRIAGYSDDMTAWRRHLHQHPELLFDCHQTAAFVVARLKEFGVTEIHEGIATTGIVAIIEGQGDGPTIGLRADMDALPLTETTGAEHASTVPGKMHACGHDGHTTMLLGAARYLAETRNFRGRVALIFQPAEEGGGGGDVMVQEGIMDRFGITQVYGLHNAPGLPEGHFATNPGALMAASDYFTVRVHGRGGHGAFPQDTLDPIAAGMAIAKGFDTIVSRNRAGLDNLVISVTKFVSGTAFNIIPDDAEICGTVRSFTPEVQEMVIARMEEIVAGTAAAYGVEAQLHYRRGYPPTVNDPEKTGFAVGVARDVAGEAAVDDAMPPLMVGEDFSYMLLSRPGAYLMLGAGPGPGLHNTGYDFNDRIAPVGASFFVRAVELAQPL